MAALPHPAHAAGCAAGGVATVAASKLHAAVLAYARGDATAVRDAFDNFCDVAPPGQLCTVPVTLASVRNLARLHLEAPDAFARLQVSVASWMEWDLLCGMRGIVALDCRGAFGCKVVLRVQVFTGASQHGA